MTEEKSFKKRVKDEIINGAKIYKENFVDYEYLICSEAFTAKEFYTIDAKEDNYQHLTGVNSLIASKDFFNKSYDKTLQESDFDFNKRGQSEKSVKGSVRRKISVLPNIIHIFENGTLVEENLIKNQIKCSFATTDKKCTLGFIDLTKSRPMSLLKGDEIDNTKAKNIDLLLRKHISKDKFNEIIIGDFVALQKYRENIEAFLDEKIITELDKMKVLLVKQELQEAQEQVASGEYVRPL